MYNHVTCVLIFISSLIIVFTNGQSFIIKSPCPDIFQYIYDGAQWFGYIQIPSPPVGQNITLTLFTTLPVQQQMKDVGLLKLTTSENETNQRIIEQKSITYMVIFPKKQLPKVRQLFYNGKEICSGRVDKFTSVILTRLESVFYSELAAPSSDNKLDKSIDQSEKNNSIDLINNQHRTFTIPPVPYIFTRLDKKSTPATTTTTELPIQITPTEKTTNLGKSTKDNQDLNKMKKFLKLMLKRIEEDDDFNLEAF